MRNSMRFSAGAPALRSAIPGDFRVKKLAPDRLQRGERPFFVRAHQPRISGNIGRQNRREFAGRAHYVGKPAPRRPSVYLATASG